MWILWLEVKIILDSYIYIYIYIYIYVRHIARGPSSPKPKSKLAHEQYSASGPPFLMINPKWPKDASPLVGNSMYGRTVSISHSLGIVIVRLYLSMLGVPRETPLPSTFRRPAPVPTFQLQFPMRSIFLLGLIKLYPTHTSGAKKHLLPTHYHKVINTQREEEEGVRYWRVKAREVTQYRCYSARLKRSATETGS